jgi:hypothetical protein
MLTQRKTRTLEGEMGIDRIGKGGAPPPAAAPSEADKAGRTSGAPAAGPAPAFDINATSAPQAASAAGRVGGASPLERLRAGELDLDGYLDAKVDQATAHLAGLPARDLATVRSILRSQIASDPALADLVAHATGQAPVPQD